MKLPKLATLVMMMTLSMASVAFAAAQTNVTTADLFRLQDQLEEVSSDVANARSRNPRLATQLETELADARDEVTYLKVKLRKNEPVARSEVLGPA